MKLQARKKLLGIYDLFLSIGAFIMGIMMLQSSYGVFREYPRDWLARIPFHSWVIPGIITIVIFGVGNMISAIFCMKKSSYTSWLMSIIMGMLLFTSIMLQILIIKELYLATVQFFLFSMLQLLLSGYVYIGFCKNETVSYSK
jgi:hypothetical protein